jgi:branched-chain amino acid transport system substrate-binding protein
MPRIKRAPVLLLTCALLMAACGGGDDGAAAGGGEGSGGAQQGEEWIIGFSSDLVGPFGNYSNNILAGTEAYFHQVNEEGGILGRPVRLEVRDDRNDVQAAVGVMQELSSLGVPVVLGNVSSVVWATTAPMAEELGLVHIAAGAVDDFVYPPQPFLYRYLMSAKMAADGALRFALEQLGEEEARIGVMRYDSAGTDAWAEAMHEGIGQSGLELTVEEQRFPANATDLTPAASAVAASNPNFLLTVMTDAQAPLGVEALRNRGYTGPIVNWVGISENTLLAVNDPDFYVIRDTVPPQLEDAAFIMEAAQAAGRADKVNHDFATNGWLAAKATAEALEKCGYPCDGAGFNDALVAADETDTEGAAGPGWGVSDESHLFSSTVSLWHLQNAGDKASVMAGDWFVPEL